MNVKCINKICLHKWNYKGKSESYISCSKCGFRFKLQRAIENYVKKDNIALNIVHNIPKKNPYNKVIEVPKTESVEKLDKEELEDQELFPERNIKLCNEHDLPASYSDYHKKWICKACSESIIKAHKPYQKI